MTDPRITAALDRLEQREASWVTDADIIKELVAVLREVAALHKRKRSDTHGKPQGWCEADGYDWPCPTARALAPLAQLGGES